MKKILASYRSKNIFALAVIAIFIGIVSKKVISFPTECSPMKNSDLTYFFKS